MSKKKKYLFSIIVSGETEAEATASLQDAHINPADMDIEELDSEKSFTVIGFYEDSNQKYAGHYLTETANEAEKEAVLKGVTVCGIIAGHHNTVDGFH